MGAAADRAVDMWTTQARCPHGPQPQQQTKKIATASNPSKETCIPPQLGHTRSRIVSETPTDSSEEALYWESGGRGTGTKARRVRTPPDQANCRASECSAIRSARPAAWLQRPEKLRKVTTCCGC